MQTDFSESERYQPHLSLPGMDASRQQMLSKSKLVVLGLTGIGCSVAQALASAGVGNLCLIDQSKVTPPMLSLTSLFTPEDVGKSSSQIAGSRLSSVNPGINITIHHDPFTSHNAEEIAE